MIKVAERGHRTSPNFPYALLTLDTVSDAYGSHEHDSMTFVTGVVGLRRMIEELSQLLTHLESAWNETVSDERPTES